MIVELQHRTQREKIPAASRAMRHRFAHFRCGRAAHLNDATTAAWQRGFHAAPRKCFIADGSETNWGVWRKYFSHYTPIVDFVHALMYVYAAAMAGETSAAGWQRYCQWAQWLWSGNTVIASLSSLTPDD
jgi:hypothetical protein